MCHRCRRHAPTPAPPLLSSSHEQMTADDAEASSFTPSPTLLCTVIIVCSVTVVIAHCHRRCAGEQGTGDDAEASSSALSPSSSVHAAAAAAIAWASEGQVMMPRHHPPPCCRRQCAKMSELPLLPPLPRAQAKRARGQKSSSLQGR
jgi:hypothetical protein